MQMRSRKTTFGFYISQGDVLRQSLTRRRVVLVSLFIVLLGLGFNEISL